MKAWARRWHGLRRGRATAALDAGVDALAASAGRRRLVTDHFQACLNSRDMFSVVKLVHVAECAEPGDEEGGWDRVPARRRAVTAFLKTLNDRTGARFDRALVGRVWDAVAAAGCGGWYPIVGFEHRPAWTSFATGARGSSSTSRRRLPPPRACSRASTPACARPAR
ncbi:MAG: hypothetical protein HYV15_01810 [Elusimicrobia bacterium]|nr:hypothetical protein [Elusimicrobiota bacterium]